MACVALPSTKSILAAAVLGCIFSLSNNVAQAVLVTSHTDATAIGAPTKDGILAPNEYGPGNSYAYAGGGGGFGGTVGAGALYMNSDAANLFIGFQAGNSVNDNVVIHLDTRTGGFTDAQMNDTADDSRELLTKLTRDVDDTFPVLPDFGIVIGTFGIVSFELTTGSLNFINFDNTFTGNAANFREYTIPRTRLGNPTVVNFFVSYGSNDNFMSNESMPTEGFNASGNPGYGSGVVAHDNYHQFVVAAVPEAGSWALTGAVTAGALCVYAVRKRRTTASIALIEI